MIHDGSAILFTTELAEVMGLEFGLIDPNGGEIFTVGDPVNVTWSPGSNTLNEETNRTSPSLWWSYYRGLKPVNWCFDCHSALAEAEVEYEDRTDAAIDVGFPLDDR